MRPFDRDLIRGGHYGQRSCEPHQQAEHMAAPTNAAFVKKVLANSEPSTHGPSQPRRSFDGVSVTWGAAVTARRGRRNWRMQLTPMTRLISGRRIILRWRTEALVSASRLRYCRRRPW